MKEYRIVERLDGNGDTTYVVETWCISSAILGFWFDRWFAIAHCDSLEIARKNIEESKIENRARRIVSEKEIERVQ